eukprot:2025918-Pyramimonas_sp.AAC.1
MRCRGQSCGLPPMLRLSLSPVRLRRQDTGIFVRSIWRPPLALGGVVCFHHQGQFSTQIDFVVDIIKILLL